jgi:hypothetical protein
MEGRSFLRAFERYIKRYVKTWREFACQDFLRENESISGFLSWTQRTLRFYIWGPSGTLVKGQDSPELIPDYGAQRAHL